MQGLTLLVLLVVVGLIGRSLSGKRASSELLTSDLQSYTGVAASGLATSAEDGAESTAASGSSGSKEAAAVPPGSGDRLGQQQRGDGQHPKTVWPEDEASEDSELFGPDLTKPSTASTTSTTGTATTAGTATGAAFTAGTATAETAK